MMFDRSLKKCKCIIVLSADKPEPKPELWRTKPEIRNLISETQRLFMKYPTRPSVQTRCPKPEIQFLDPMRDCSNPTRHPESSTGSTLAHKFSWTQQEKHENSRNFSDYQKILKYLQVNCVECIILHTAESTSTLRSPPIPTCPTSPTCISSTSATSA